MNEHYLPQKSAEFYDFTGNPIEFVPSNGFNGGNSFIDYSVRYQNQILCNEYINVDYPNSTGGTGKLSLKVAPNPVENYTEVNYKIAPEKSFERAKIKIFTLTGMLKKQRKLQKAEGTERFNLGSLPSGTYILVFYLNGQNAGQQILVKE